LSAYSLLSFEKDKRQKQGKKHPSSTQIVFLIRRAIWNFKSLFICILFSSSSEVVYLSEIILLPANTAASQGICL
jgi:hypothetical protein